MRPVVDWDSAGVPFPAGYSEPVVVVADPRGWEWHLTAEGSRITSLTIRGAHVDAAALRRVPLGYLAEVATVYLGEVERALDRGISLAAALESVDAEPGSIRLSSDAPTLGAFAEAWKETPAAEIRNAERITRRELLAKRYGVTVWAIDKHTRAARDAGLIPVATVGRHRDPKTTTGGRPDSTHTTEEKK